MAFPTSATEPPVVATVAAVAVAVVVVVVELSDCSYCCRRLLKCQVQVAAYWLIPLLVETAAPLSARPIGRLDPSSRQPASVGLAKPLSEPVLAAPPSGALCACYFLAEPPPSGATAPPPVVVGQLTVHSKCILRVRQIDSPPANRAIGLSLAGRGRNIIEKLGLVRRRAIISDLLLALH